MRIALTRPSPDAERTAAALRARGHDVVLAPLMEIETIAADLGGAWSGVIMTSANAVRAVNRTQRAALARLPAFVVGRRTAEAARDAGFADVRSADGDGGALAKIIAAACQGAASPLLYLAGETRAFDLEAELRARGVAASTIAVYRALTLPLPAALGEALRSRSIEAVLHFSRRSAEHYLSAAGDAGLGAAALLPRHFCLSAQIAALLAAQGAKDIRVAREPDEAALLDLLESR